MSEEYRGRPCRGCGRWCFAVVDLSPSGYCMACALALLVADLQRGEIAWRGDDA